jgi:hypothetical protein
LQVVRNNWIGAEGKFHIGVSDNAANVTLALDSDVRLEASDDVREEIEESDDDDGEDRFPTLPPMHVGSAGCFAHLLNLIVGVNI